VTLKLLALRIGAKCDSNVSDKLEDNNVLRAITLPSGRRSDIKEEDCKRDAAESPTEYGRSLGQECPINRLYDTLGRLL